MVGSFYHQRPMKTRIIFETSVQSKAIPATTQRDQEIIGSYVEHCPDDPILPDGCQTIEVVTVHKPEVITLTYGQIMEHLSCGYIIALEHEALEKFREQFDADERYSGFALDLMGNDEFSVTVEMEKKNAG